MEIGVIVPSGVPGVDAETIGEWCRRIDEGPFSTLAVPDRLVYPNLEPLTVLGYAAAATSRVRLATTIAIAPLRGAALFAKQAATLAVLCEGRLSLGVGAGAREYDYDAAGVEWSRRCALVVEALEAVERVRSPEDDQALGPAPPQFEILIGGARRNALQWLARFGDGYTSGGIKPEFFGYEVQATLGAWAEAGKPGRPRIVAGTWCASEERYEETRRNLDHYLLMGGPPEFIRDQIWRGEEGVRECVAAFAALGADEVVFFPHVADVGELEWLGELAAELGAEEEAASRVG